MEIGTLEDIKGALLDDMNAMMQDELRQALAGLMPPPAPVIANPLAAAVAPTVIAPAATNPPALLLLLLQIHLSWMLHPLTMTMLGGNL